MKELQGLEDPYALSIIAYVLQLSNHPFRENAFNIMEGFAKVSGMKRMASKTKYKSKDG